jgi:hypothetical protein
MYVLHGNPMLKSRGVSPTLWIKYIFFWKGPRCFISPNSYRSTSLVFNDQLLLNIRRRAFYLNSHSSKQFFPSKIFIYLIFSFLLFIHSFICTYIVWVISSPTPPLPAFPPNPLSPSHPPLASRQKLFCPYL